jgi:hypothetical protein
MRWARNEARMREIKHAYTILVGNIKLRDQLGYLELHWRIILKRFSKK